MSSQLRYYQTDGIAQLRSAIRQGHRKLLLVLPTGAGKTTVAAEIIRSAEARGQRVLFLAHRKELVEQAHERFKHFGVHAGVIMADWRPNHRKPVQVGSLATLVRRTAPGADLVIVDEAHHSVSASFIKLLTETYPAAIIIGLTATPYRLDNRGLGDIYTHLVAPVSIAQLTQEGHLVPARYFGPKNDSRSRLSVTGGDFNTKDAFAEFNKRELYAGVVEHYERFANATRAIVFNVSIEHSKQVAAAFRDAGIAARHLDSETPTWEREQVLKEFKAGEWQVLCNVALFTEGFDAPGIETVILNRPTKSRALYFQMVGRALRPAPGKGYAIVLDHGGNVREFGPVDQPENHTLEPTPPKGSGVAPVKDCPACEAIIFASARECPVCGAACWVAAPVYAEDRLAVDHFDELDVSDFLPKEVLKKNYAPALPANLRKSYHLMSDDELRETQQLRGYAPGWVYHQQQRRAAFDAAEEQVTA